MVLTCTTYDKDQLSTVADYFPKAIRVQVYRTLRVLVHTGEIVPMGKYRDGSRKYPGKPANLYRRSDLAIVRDTLSDRLSVTVFDNVPDGYLDLAAIVDRYGYRYNITDHRVVSYLFKIVGLKSTAEYTKVKGKTRVRLYDEVSVAVVMRGIGAIRVTLGKVDAQRLSESKPESDYMNTATIDRRDCEMGTD